MIALIGTTRYTNWSAPDSLKYYCNYRNMGPIPPIFNTQIQMVQKQTVRGVFSKYSNVMLMLEDLDWSLKKDRKLLEQFYIYLH